MTRCDLCHQTIVITESEFAFTDTTGWQWFRHYAHCAFCDNDQIEFEGIEDTERTQAMEARRRERQDGFYSGPKGRKSKNDTSAHFRRVAQAKIRPFRAKD